MELSAPPCLPKCPSSSMLLKSRVRVFHRTLNPTPSPFRASIFSVNHRNLARMDPTRNLSSAALVGDNHTPATSASSVDSGQQKPLKLSSFSLFHSTDGLRFSISDFFFPNYFFQWIWMRDWSFSGARIGEVKRVTKETNVSVKINLDGSGVADSSTGIPFLDHMLDVSDFKSTVVPFCWWHFIFLFDDFFNIRMFLTYVYVLFC